MIFTVSLPGTILANVRYQWLVAGALGGALSAGITAVDALFPYEFRIDAVPPTDFEELYAYDVTDATNYTKGRPQIATPPDNSGIAAIKTQTDKLAFTVTNQVDANTKSINDTTITGDGQPGTEFGV